jgi:hypothetical protein
LLAKFSDTLISIASTEADVLPPKRLALTCESYHHLLGQRIARSAQSHRDTLVSLDWFAHLCLLSHAHVLLRLQRAPKKPLLRVKAQSAMPAPLSAPNDSLQLAPKMALRNLHQLRLPSALIAMHHSAILDQMSIHARAMNVQILNLANAMSDQRVLSHVKKMSVQTSNHESARSSFLVASRSQLPMAAMSVKHHAPTSHSISHHVTK